MADLPVSSSSPLGGFEFPVLHSDAGYWDLPLEETNSQTCLNAIPQHQTISAPPIIPSHPTIITSPFGGVGNEVKIKEFVERIRKKVNGSEPTKPVLGLEELQQTIVDAIVAPQKFTIHSDLQVQAILLAGPPGCAKTTMLLQSVILSATRLQKPISYYKLLYSDALSSFVGESEKIIKFLFENAIENQPSVILIDEVDGLMRKRKDEESDHTSRFKSALLTQMQGYTNSSGVVLIATTNLPHTMDEGFQRRFQERFLVRLPTFEERVIIYDYFVSLCENTGKVDWDSFDFKQLSSKSQRRRHPQCCSESIKKEAQQGRNE
ncbi:unnamed protein product [Orchesella dallaii]|uniref:AAA+ ATPase domain-containing protein n=1 Tax=Orchesella dallaii TaxID=48710 RepID=A0ABP1PXA3_9HEXA